MSEEHPDGDDQETLIEFPCDFPIKIMGRAEQDMDSVARTLIDQTLDADRLLDSRSATSNAGRFVSVTITVRVEDKSELDAVYAALTTHPQVMMVL